MNKFVSAEDQAVINEIVATEYPGKYVFKNDTLDEHRIITGFSVDSIKYAYDEWNVKSIDVILASYPKTGTNFTAEILQKILFDDDQAASELFKSLPMPMYVLEMGGAKKFDLLDRLPLSRRLQSTHLPGNLVNVAKIKKANAKIVYVLRNPKDQMVSHLRFMQDFQSKGGDSFRSAIQGNWNTFFELCLSGTLRMNMKRGEWYPHHILSWYKHLDYKNVYFLYYEDLKTDLAKEIRLLCQFLDVPKTNDQILEIARSCRFENMKKTVQTDDQRNKDRSDVVLASMHEGTVGTWKNYFTVSQSERLDSIIDEKLQATGIKFKYKL